MQKSPLRCDEIDNVRPVSDELPVHVKTLMATPPSLPHVASAGPTSTHAAARALPIDDRRFELGDERGQGGVGRVFRARDLRLERTVAVKELTPGAGARAEARFVREALVTARLQHPGIVPVYDAGQRPDGKPYFAMRLVAGRTLDDAVRAAAGLEARLAFVPHVLTGAETIAYAHSEGVVHRDIKPGNVMVGDYGETVVVDWGLARDLRVGASGDGEDDDDDQGKGLYEASHAERTRVGAVIGTPPYMPPEQARGEAVGERADIYAIGAILYFVLAGQPPYAGDVEAVLTRLTSEPPPPLTQLVRDAPRDLVAVVEKAMARDPERRYATAKELAGDLARFATGQLVSARRYSLGTLIWRWVRRHRAAVAVATLLSLLLVVSSTLGIRRIVLERDRAEEQKSVAERQKNLAEGERRAAESLAQFMLVDLRDKLLPIGKLELLEGVGTRVETYYKSLTTSVGTLDAARRHQRAQALVILADVQRGLGKRDQARASYQAAATLFEALSQEKPADLEILGNVVEGHLHLGELATEAGDLGAALSEFRAALATSERLLQLSPAEDEHANRAVYKGHLRLGDALRNHGEIEAALAEYRASLAIAQRFEAMPKSATVWSQDLVDSLTRVGDMEEGHGDLAAAIPHYREAAERIEKLAAASPDDTRLQTSLVIARVRVGDSHTEQHDHAAAARSYASAADAMAKLVATDPKNLMWKRMFAMMRLKQGDAESEQGHLDEAMTWFQTSRELMAPLQAGDPENAQFLRDLAVIYERIGNTELSREHHGAARQAYQEHLKLARLCAAKAPTNATFQSTVATALFDIAQAEGAVDHIDAALAGYREALAIYEKLAVADPANVDLRHSIGVMQAGIAEDLLAKGQLAPALEAARASLAIMEKLSHDDPARATWKAAEGFGAGRVGRVLARTPATRDEARKLYGRALELLHALARDDRLSAEHVKSMHKIEAEAARL